MALVEMVMPKMGESIMEGTVLKWLKNIGDSIEQDESVLEVATDKVDTEVPAIHAGVLKEILAQEGDVVPVGKPIAIIMQTIMGKGVDFMENDHNWHGVAPNDEQLKKAFEQLPVTLGDY